jgi:hypothetical protein
MATPSVRRSLSAIRPTRRACEHLHRSGLGLRDRGRSLTKDRTSDLLGIQAVGLAVQTPGQPVRPVHLHHPLASPGQCHWSGWHERSGAFHPDHPNLTVAAHPGQQRLVAVVGGRKLLTQQPALLVKCGCAVGVFVVVDAADDSGCFGCHAGIRSSVRADLIDRAAGRAER